MRIVTLCVVSVIVRTTVDAQKTDPGKPAIVQVHGQCDNYKPHEAHIFVAAEYSTHTSLWDCRGQYSDCRNCDDQKCMDCVTRTLHSNCEDSCPDCCP